MILERGNMWDAFGQGIFMITTNPIVRKDGAVVMGRGIALEAKTRFPELPFLFGERLQENGGKPFIDYICHCGNTPIWYFMVKDHWREPAKKEIIQKSVEELSNWITQENLNLRIDLNFPGIGNGGLAREEVLPIIQQLPDNVHVWEYA